MLQIFKAQLFQYKKRSLITTVFLAILALDNIQLLIRAIFGEPFTADEFIIDSAAMTAFLGLIFTVINTCYICTGDFSDKTACYEIMTGHTRLEVFLGRLLFSLLSSVIGFYIILAMPAVICTALFGWGSAVPFPDMIKRMLLIVFPVIRTVCEAAFISFILRNPMIAGGLGVMTLLGVSSVMSALPPSDSVFLSMTNLNRLLTFSPWMTYGLGTNAAYITYDAYIEPEYVLSSAAASIGFGALFCIIGYLFFRQDDIQ